MTTPKATKHTTTAVVPADDIIEIVDGRLIVNVAANGNSVSASGKSKVLFSTHGNIKLANGVTIGINAYTKA